MRWSHPGLNKGGEAGEDSGGEGFLLFEYKKLGAGIWECLVLG